MKGFRNFGYICCHNDGSPYHAKSFCKIKKRLEKCGISGIVFVKKYKIKDNNQ